MVELEIASVVPLNVARRARLDLERAEVSLGRQQIAWLGRSSQEDAGEGERRRFRADLHLPLHAARRVVSFRKAALVDLGPVRRLNGRLLVDVGWRSATLAPLFPVFAGRLIVEPGRLTLEGLYAPPLGRLGVALDRVLLGIAARGTARWFLDQVVAGLESGARSDRSAGDGHRDDGPAAPARADGQPPVDQPGLLAHADQAQLSGGGEL